MKNPHLEIERKFLIRRLPRTLHRHPHCEIAQGYLAVDRHAQRPAAQKGGGSALSQFKRGPARAREEREIHLNSGPIRHPLARHDRRAPNENTLLRPVAEN
jgi:hypothetical protein